MKTMYCPFEEMKDTLLKRMVWNTDNYSVQRRCYAITSDAVRR